MNKLIFLFMAACLTGQISLAKKRALIIAVGAYPTETGWGTISSLNDVPLIQQTLTTQGFATEDITVVTDAQATKAGIIDALTQLQDRSERGDIIVIHYSGHGQQIFDDNGDEIDGKDEAKIGRATD